MDQPFVLRKVFDKKEYNLQGPDVIKDLRQKGIIKPEKKEPYIIQESISRYDFAKFHTKSGRGRDVLLKIINSLDGKIDSTDTVGISEKEKEIYQLSLALGIYNKLFFKVGYEEEGELKSMFEKSDYLRSYI